jgi:hypothetical protein
MAVAVDTEAVLTTEGFAAAHGAFLQEKIEVWPARSWYPSSLGHPCDRFLVWSATRHFDKAPHDVTLQSIFEQGKDHEPIIRRRLEAMGFEIMRDDRPRQYPARAGAMISGKPDGRIVAYRGVKVRPPVIAELKSMSGYQFDKTYTLDDLRHADSHWTRSYYAQGMVYCFLENEPRGVFVIESKATGMLRLIPFELDYGYVEKMLQRIETLQPMRQARIDPPPITYSFAICGSCGFADQCYPARSFGEGADVIDDEELIRQLVERDRMAPGAKEYDRLDKDIKARLKHDGIKFAIAGDFVIDGRVVSKREYTVPARDETHYSIKRTGDPEAEA